jgi:hypothetical protein
VFSDSRTIFCKSLGPVDLLRPIHLVHKDLSFQTEPAPNPPLEFIPSMGCRESAPPTTIFRRKAEVRPACKSLTLSRVKDIRLLKHTCLILMALAEAWTNAAPIATAEVSHAGAVARRLPPCEPISAAPVPPQVLPQSAGATNRVRPASFIAPADLPLAVEGLGAQTPAVESSNLAEAIETALERNPNLVALRQSEPVSQAALGVARTYPFNPYAQIQVLPLSRDRFGGSTPVSHYVLLMQTLELAHQRRYRDAAGTADLTRIQWTIHQAELTNIALTERMFFAAIYQRGIRYLAF